MYNILICDDERDIVSALKIYLRRDDCRLFEAYTGKEALEILQKEDIHLVLMDIMMPVMDGITATVEIRKTSNVPIILLTAKSEDTDKVLGLDLGADDYIPKPFRPRELVSRIKNVLRLTGNTGKTVKLGDVVVDTEKGTAMKNNKDLFLSALEYRLLLVFINNRGIVLTRTQLLDAIWDVAGEFVNDNTLTVYIKRLREKIEDDPTNPKIIMTVRGLGYKVEV